MRLQIPFLPQRSPLQHNPWSISLALHFVTSAFLIISPAQASWGSYAAQCPNGSDCFCFQAALVLIRLMRLIGWSLCWFAVIAHQKCQNVLLWNIDHCILRWLRCWARCWMLQDVDNLEASCVFYVKVSTFTHPEQSKPALLTVNNSGMVRLTVQHDLIVSISFLDYPGGSLRQASADIFSLEQFPISSWPSCDFSCCSPRFISVNKETTTDGHMAYLRAVCNLCNLQQCAAGFILSITHMLVANYSILRWS